MSLHKLHARSLRFLTSCRTAALSRISGFSTVGQYNILVSVTFKLTNRPGIAISLSVGGAITTHFHDIGPVYIVALILQSANLLYISLLIPETLQKGQRDDDPSPDESIAPRGNILVRPLRSCYNGIASAFIPLKTIRPTRDPRTGKFNARLLYCGVHVFIVGLGDGYVTPALIVYLTTKYDYTPQEVCILLPTLLRTASDIVC